VRTRSRRRLRLRGQRDAGVPRRPRPRPTDRGLAGASWYYKKESKTCETFVAKKSKNCKKKDEFKVGRGVRGEFLERCRPGAGR